MVAALAHIQITTAMTMPLHHGRSLRRQQRGAAATAQPAICGWRGVAGGAGAAFNCCLGLGSPHSTAAQGSFNCCLGLGSRHSTAAQGSFICCSGLVRGSPDGPEAPGGCEEAAGRAKLQPGGREACGQPVECQGERARYGLVHPCSLSSHHAKSAKQLACGLRLERAGRPKHPSKAQERASPPPQPTASDQEPTRLPRKESRGREDKGAEEGQQAQGDGQHEVGVPPPLHRTRIEVELFGVGSETGAAHSSQR